MKRIVIGSRGSQLALAQTHWIAGHIRELNPEVEVSIQIIKTTGDKLTTASLAQLAGDTKGLFVKEIEEALLREEIDLAVHSLKDVPTELPEGLRLGIIPPREDPRDALISNHEVTSIDDLPHGGRIGTSSLRRQAQLLHLRSDLKVVPIRGNVDTRLRKLEEEGLDGILLAAAGLKRLGLGEKITFLFPPEQMVPAIGQGALAVEIRQEDPESLALLSPLEDPGTRRCVSAERSFLREMGGGCQVPMGGHARLEGSQAFFSAFIGSPSGGQSIRKSLQGAADSLDDLAREAVDYLRGEGASRILKEVGL